MNDDVIIAAQREKIDELEEQVRQLKKLLVPIFVTPVEWGLTAQQKTLFCMLLKRDLVTRDMFNAVAITRPSTKNAANQCCDMAAYHLRKKLKKYGIPLNQKEIDDFARADGFKNGPLGWTAVHAMGSFFKRHHGFGTFYGVVIHWRFSEPLEAAS